MKIFFLITKSETGGAQTHVAQLTKFFISRGGEVAIMSAPGGWLEDEAKKLGARFFPNPALSNSLNPLRLLKAASVLSHAIQEARPDLVACHSTMAGLLGRLTLRNRIPTVFTAHGWGFMPGAPLSRRLLIPILERLAARCCSRIICVSQNDLALAHKYHIAPDDKLALVYNGIELAQIEAYNYLRHHHDKTINIYFIGRLAQPKNPFLLVEAFSQLPRELQDKAHITIIGDGPDRARLKALVDCLHLTTHVELTGTLHRENVLERLRSQADIFVLVSHWEGFPYSILEAMAAGVPVIASRVGGIPEALEQGGGRLVDGDDLDALKRALSMFIQDDRQRAAMGAQARRAVEERFDVSQMCEKTFEIYRCSLEKPKVAL